MARAEVRRRRRLDRRGLDGVGHVVPLATERHETAEFVDAEGLLAWFRAEGIYSPLWQREHNQQRLKKWARPGARASVWTVDRMLVEVGRHLNELPAELFIEPDADQLVRVYRATYEQERLVA